MTKEVEEYRGNIYKYSCDNPECNETVTSEKVPEDIWLEKINEDIGNTN